MPFLEETYDRGIENNLYPFVVLNVDGTLFVFANNRAILFDNLNNKVVKTYAEIPGGDPRCYPSTGSAVLLPLKNLEAPTVEAQHLLADHITDPNPQWTREAMPGPKVMSDAKLLTNGHVCLINGGATGVAGWDMGWDPVLNPFIYRPDEKLKSRFESQNPTTIPRMYHSTAVLLRNGRVLVGGNNPHRHYNFTDVLFLTELSLEAFSPSYLDLENSSLRPKIVSLASQTELNYKQKVVVSFTVKGSFVLDEVTVPMVASSFTTQSFSMSQRVLVLGSENVRSL